MKQEVPHTCRWVNHDLKNVHSIKVKMMCTVPFLRRSKSSFSIDLSNCAATKALD